MLTPSSAHPSHGHHHRALRTVLEARGDDAALAGTRAVPRWCRTCRRAVLAGYDAPVLAGLAIADPYRATWQQEAAAVILARPTWWLAGPWPTRGELIPRHTPALRPLGVRPPADQVLVVIGHDCNTPPLATGLLPTARTSAHLPVNPPF